MTDLYLKAFHDDDKQYKLREMPGRMLAAIATPGFGGAMGLEGGSIYLGSWLGTFLQRRFPRFTAGSSRRVLLVAGAAAGVAAVFKAPATGALFALEVPYQEDLARRMLLPALVASASSYLAFVAVNGITPVFEAHGSPPLSFADLAGAIALGIAAGVCARGYAWLVRRAKWLIDNVSPWIRIVGSGLTIAALFAITWLLTDKPLAIGIGYHTIDWALNPTRAVWLVLVVLVVRCLTNVATVAASGVGGLFIPLVVAGALLGRVAFGVVGGTRPHPVRRHRRRRVPGRGVPRAAGGGDVRGRDHGSSGLHRPRVARRGGRHAGDGPGVRDPVPAELSTGEHSGAAGDDGESHPLE